MELALVVPPPTDSWAMKGGSKARCQIARSLRLPCHVVTYRQYAERVVSKQRETKQVALSRQLMPGVPSPALKLERQCQIWAPHKINVAQSLRTSRWYEQRTLKSDVSVYCLMSFGTFCQYIICESFLNAPTLQLDSPPNFTHHFLPPASPVSSSRLTSSLF